MRYAIISDIHANLEALEAAARAISRDKIDEFLSVGDIVGYGADPAACIKRVKSLTSVFVCGNHDAAASGAIDTESFNDAARQAVLWTQKKLNGENEAFLRNLELVHKNNYLTLVHGTLQEPGAFHYMFDHEAAKRTFELMDTPVCFIGHSHAPGIFTYKNGTVNYFYKSKVKLEKDEKLIVNVGSIGQPRDGDPRLCYAIYDVDENSVELKRHTYNIEKAQKKILDAGLPTFLAYRLEKGI
ncbi:metallophosphoesterase family protein [Candidatus Omnitrophota bacterium]